MRAFKTYRNNKEVMYAVLVHRPDDEEIFLDYPLLTETSNPASTDENGRIIGGLRPCVKRNSESIHPGRVTDHLITNADNCCCFADGD